MANLAPKRHRSNIMVKLQDSNSPAQKSPHIKIEQEAIVTPPKRSHVNSIDDLVTIKRSEIDRSGPNLFSSSQSYRLDYLNSITYDDGKLYNLLTANSQKYKNGRKVKCKCSKSRCESKYCQCFSRGVICGVECECTNCHNLTWMQRDNLGEEQKGCRCSKSHCLKNYCECFQRGQRCGDKCNCNNCQNIS